MPLELPYYAIASDGSISFFSGGTLAERPQPGQPNRLYIVFEPTGNYLLRDTGAGWENVGSSEGASSILEKLLTVDGTGSELDADLLDGVQGADYARSDDTRLSDARPPTAHGHPSTDVSYAGSANLSATDVEAALDELDVEKAAVSQLHGRNHALFSSDHPDVDVADTPATGEVLTFDGTKWVASAAGGVLVATEARQGTVKGNAPASETTDPKVYFRSDPIHAGFRDGCVSHWQSATDIRVRPGALWIPSLRRIVDVPTELSIVPTLAANTLGYLYVYDNAGTPAVELSTTAAVNATTTGFANPSGHPLRGACRVKGPADTPDFSRRYVGAVLATATANQIHGFRYEGNLMLYRADPNLAPFLVLAGGGAATNFAISFAAIVPPTSRTALADAYAATGFFYLQTSEDAFGDSTVIGSTLVQGTTAALHYVALNDSRVALYEASAASGAAIRTLGYMEAR